MADSGLSNDQITNILKYSGYGAMGTGMLGLLFGGGDPTKKAQSTIGQIPGQIKPYYQPYMDAGTGAMSTLEDQYSKLLTDPGAMFNQMGESFQKSPGFDFAMQQALQGSGHAAAAGGMAGSPEHEQQNEQLATNLANQDYYNYMDHVMPMYTEGLHGEQDLMHQGFNATKDMTQAIARALAAQSLLQAQSAKAKAQSQSNMFSDIAGGAALAFGL